MRATLPITAAAFAALSLTACDLSTEPIGGGIGQPLAATAVAAGRASTCALGPSNAIFCWGSGYATTATQISDEVGAVELVAGKGHFCGLTAQGRVYCWGSNDNGQLGVRGSNSSREPVLANVPGTAVALAAGDFHTCAVLEDQSTYCWGSDDVGQLGDGTGMAEPPVMVKDAPAFTALAAGDDQSCGITASVTSCWGLVPTETEPDFFQADEPQTIASGPADPSPVVLSAITAGDMHVCGLDATGRALCWGDASRGQVGAGETAPLCRTAEGESDPGLRVCDWPTPVDGDRPFTQIDAGDRHTCALTGAGDLFCWGDNLENQLGAVTTATCFQGRACSRTPVQVFLQQRFDAVAAGGEHSCGLVGQSVVCWGRNTAGQLGNGTTEDAAEPVTVRVATF